MKNALKHIIVSILGWQVRRLHKKHDFKVVGVAGSIGKTSTKFAVATVLQQKYRVQFQAGNYNDIVTVPLIFFGAPLPSLLNPIAWARVLWRNERHIRQAYPYDVVVVEVGTDYPGNIPLFGKYLQCDIAVVTAITPEHMEFFQSLDEVAEEELSVSRFSKELVVNTDLCAPQYLNVPVSVTGFGAQLADYHISHIGFKGQAADFSVNRNGKKWLSARMEAVAKSELYSATAAAVVADKLGLTPKAIAAGIATIQPVSGRMQRLNGIKNSLILDETYNASPDAVMAALDSLYGFDAPQKIALLGNMNELGETSAASHRAVGEYCEPEQLDLVVTLGPDANEHLAPAAVERGCLVKTFDDPHSAGEFIKNFIKPKAVILAKGSQNNVYAEEAIKPLLADPQDVSRLVRQSPAWLKTKQENFAK